MFQLLGMFSKALGMFYAEKDAIPSTPESEILTESGDFLMTQSSEYLTTE